MRKGFTLAEILIVLTIIGVVACLGIPTLIAHIIEVKRIAQVKVISSVLSNAGELALVDRGTLTGASPDFLIPYLRVLGTSEGTDNSLGLRTIKLQNGNTFPETFNNKKYVLANGIVVMPRMIFPECDYKQQDMDNICGDIFVSVDGGKARNNNVAGKDTYYFWITSTGIIANREDNIDDKYPINLKDYGNDCNVNGSGWGCSGHYVIGGYLHD